MRIRTVTLMTPDRDQDPISKQFVWWAMVAMRRGTLLIVSYCIFLSSIFGYILFWIILEIFRHKKGYFSTTYANKLGKKTRENVNFFLFQVWKMPSFIYQSFLSVLSSLQRSFFFMWFIKCRVKYCNTDTNVQFCLYRCKRVYILQNTLFQGREGGGGGGLKYTFISLQLY